MTLLKAKSLIIAKRQMQSWTLGADAEQMQSWTLANCLSTVSFKLHSIIFLVFLQDKCYL